MFCKPRQYGQDEEQTKSGRFCEVVDGWNEAAAAAAVVAQPASGNDVHQVNVSIANDSAAVGDDTVIGACHMGHSPNSADNDV